MSRKILLLVGIFCILRPAARGEETPEETPARKLQFGDSSYPSSSWTYLEEKAPDLVQDWDSMDLTQQLEALSRVRGMAEKRGQEEFGRFASLVNSCGHDLLTPGKDGWNEFTVSQKPEPSCDLRTISSVSDSELDTLERWSRDAAGKKNTEIREQRKHALQLLSDVKAGSLLDEDVAWAKENCSPTEAATMESAKQALLHSAEQSDSMLSGVRSVLDANFARDSTLQLHGALEETGADGVFDGAHGGRGQGASLDRRLDDLVYTSEGERGFARDWNEAVASRLRSYDDPVSKELLAGLDSRLPAIHIGPRGEGGYGAYSTEGAGLITLNGDMVVDSIWEAVNKDLSLATEDCRYPGGLSSERLASCLHANPKLLRAVVDDFEDVNVHELEHVVQAKRFGFDRTPGASQMESKQAEREAFIKQMTWLSYHSDSRLFTSDSTLAKGLRSDFRSYYRDPDATLRDFDAREKGPPDILELRRGRAELIHNETHATLNGLPGASQALDRYVAGAKPLEKMDAYYADYFPKAEQDWNSRSPGALLALARFEKDPLARLEDLAAARPRLAKGAEADWADAEIAKSEREANVKFRTYPDRAAVISDASAYQVGRQLRDYEDSLTALGKPFPPELKDLRKTTYARTLEQELGALQGGGLSQRDRDFNIADGLRLARALGDAKAEKVLLELQRRPLTNVGRLISVGGT